MLGFSHHFTIPSQVAIVVWITLAFVLFVQLADELPRLPLPFLSDLVDDLPETFKQTPEAIAALLENWGKLFPGASIIVCIETKRGALINALLEYSHLQIVPVNPNQLANYRKSFKHGGGKSDSVDALLILQFLDNYRSELRPLQQDSAITRELALLTHHRRELVNQRVNLSQQLIDVLKCYFPLILKLKSAKIYAD